MTLGEKLNDPQGEVAVYDSLLQRFGESDLPAVQEQCATALVNKGVTLGEKLDDPQGAVAVYDSLLQRYGESALPAVQEQCATALVNKGVDAGRKARRPAGRGGGVRQPAATLWRFRPPRRAGAVRHGAGQQGRDAG